MESTEAKLFEEKVQRGVKNLRKVSSVTSVLCFIIAFSFIVSYQKQKHKNLTQIKKEAQRELSEAITDLELILSEIKRAGDEFAKEFNEGKISNEQIIQKLKRITDKNENVYGVGVAFVPYKYKIDKRLYAPYYVRKPKDEFSDDDDEELYELMFVETVYDYTDKEYDWYHTAQIVDSSIWIEPYLGKVSQAILADYTIPLKRNNETIATFLIEYSVDDLRDLIQSLDIGKTGYGMITSEKNKIISHPEEELVKIGKNIKDLDETKEIKKLISLVELNKRGIIENKKNNSWIFNEPLPCVKWNMQMFFFKDEINLTGASLRHKLIWIGVFILLGTIFTLCVFLYNRPYFLSFLITFFFMVAIGQIWYLTLSKNPQEKKINVIKIDNKGSLDKFYKAHLKKSKENDLGPPIYIPTGFYIQNLSFDGASSISLTGNVWMKFHEDEDLQKTFLFSNQIDLTKEKIEDKNKYIKWWIKSGFHQKFDYSKYPFDTQEITIRATYPEISENILLVPEIEAYRETNFISKIGLSREFTLPGWTIEGTYFSMRPIDYGTTFGDEDYFGQKKTELVYSIMLKRDFLGPFISKFLTIFVVLFTLHFTILLGTHIKEEVGVFGWSTMAAISAAIAVFYVVGSGHIALRNELDLSGIIYLEYFYFVTYLAILFVTVNSYLFTNKTHIELIYYNDNVISKTMFFPSILFFVYIVTLFYHY